MSGEWECWRDGKLRDIKDLVWGPLRNVLLFFFFSFVLPFFPLHYLSPLLLPFLPLPDFSPDWVSRKPVVFFSLPLPLAPSQSQLGSLRTKEAAGRHCFHKSSHILCPKSTYTVFIISSSVNGEQLYALCVFPELHREPWYLLTGLGSGFQWSWRE